MWFTGPSRWGRVGNPRMGWLIAFLASGAGAFHSGSVITWTAPATTGSDSGRRPR